MEEGLYLDINGMYGLHAVGKEPYRRLKQHFSQIHFDCFLQGDNGEDWALIEFFGNVYMNEDTYIEKCERVSNFINIPIIDFV